MLAAMSYSFAAVAYIMHIVPVIVVLVFPPALGAGLVFADHVGHVFFDRFATARRLSNSGLTHGFCILQSCS